MAIKEKFIGDAKLPEQPSKKIGFKIKEGSVTTDKIAEGAVTENKLSEELRSKINSGAVQFSLGFYNDDDPPTPLLMLAVRPDSINAKVKPYLLNRQEDISNVVRDWQWTRESDFPELDAAWNAQAKARERLLHLTGADFPTGWELSNKMTFKCTATFYYDNEQQSLVNIITIV